METCNVCRNAGMLPSEIEQSWKKNEINYTIITALLKDIENGVDNEAPERIQRLAEALSYSASLLH